MVYARINLQSIHITKHIPLVLHKSLLYYAALTSAEFLFLNNMSSSLKISLFKLTRQVIKRSNQVEYQSSLFHVSQEKCKLW